MEEEMTGHWHLIFLLWALKPRPLRFFGPSVFIPLRFFSTCGGLNEGTCRSNEWLVEKRWSEIEEWNCIATDEKYGKEINGCKVSSMGKYISNWKVKKKAAKSGLSFSPTVYPIKWNLVFKNIFSSQTQSHSHSLNISLHFAFLGLSYPKARKPSLSLYLSSHIHLTAPSSADLANPIPNKTFPARLTASCMAKFLFTLLYPRPKGKTRAVRPGPGTLSYIEPLMSRDKWQRQSHRRG